MMTVERIDLSDNLLDICADWSVAPRARNPGPPERIDGLTLGIVTVQPDQSPHNGEMHPDGDEILYVVSGTLRITCDTAAEPIDLTSGQACIVRKGEWHKVDSLEETLLIHITPGPNGEARFN